MTKAFGVLLVLVVLLPSAQAANKRFAKYKRVEAYEIRPGVLMLPSYSGDGKVCEIGLEVLHYSPKVTRMDSELPRKEINQIFNELVSLKERGPKSRTWPAGLTVQVGFASTEIFEYKNVELDIDSRVSPDPGYDEEPVSNLVAEIRWKHRKCQ